MHNIVTKGKKFKNEGNFFENYRKSCPLTQPRVDTGLSCQLTQKRSSLAVGESSLD